ncbi:neuropeptides capa receptor-like [Hypanus sabinus]|uniref:neuropeptides capa receptor-like n=1 Tax=Hypanus sabinus TaxID=79690 RepID=UPI0028C38B7F|nr:neuropeptides capa receptor-like [Hypanus sabinus]
MEKTLKTFDSFQRIFYIIISVVGVPVNLVAIAILSRGKCGLSTCTTRYLVVMAAADLLAVVTAVILRRISFYFSGTFLDIYPYCSVIFVLMCATRDCSVWFTVTFTFDRFVLICCQKLKTRYCTGKTAAVVLATTGALLCLKNVPFYVTSEPRVIIDNVPWFCDRKPAYYKDPGWVEYSRFDKVVVPLLPFVVIILFNILTVRHILLASRVRKALRRQGKGENQSDPEMESRRRSVILLFTISGSFILLWLTTLIDYLYYNVSGRNPNYYNPAEYIFRQVGYILQNVSLCTNTFIYGVTQAKFRQEFVNAVKYPVNALIRIINK